MSLTPGKEHKFGLDCRHGLRICSVASGRVDVALGKLNFGIGVGGMWRIKRKESCVAKNNGEQVAVLHLTSIP